MIYEIAQITIKEGSEEAFEAAVKEASQYFKAAEGCVSFKLQRCIEEPSDYNLLVGWNTLEDHTITFRESDGFTKWRELASPYFTKPPAVKHVENVLELF